MTYDTLVKRINGRRAIIDACLPPCMVENLLSCGVKSLYVEYWLKSGVKDNVIESHMETNDVLITRDYEFAKHLGDRAILLKGYPKFGSLLKYNHPPPMRKETLNIRILRGMRLMFDEKRKIVYPDGSIRTRWVPI